MLNVGRGLKATNGVDHLYAFLGSPLSTLRWEDGSAVALAEPDYTKHAKRVFLEVACTIMGGPQVAPYVLLFVHHSSGQETATSNYPSWVPRWDRHGLGLPTAGAPPCWYQAGGVEESKLDVKMLVGENRILPAGMDTGELEVYWPAGGKRGYRTCPNRLQLLSLTGCSTKSVLEVIVDNEQ